MKLVNLTGRPFSLYDVEGDLVRIEPDARFVGIVAVGDHHTVADDAGHTFSLNVRRIRGLKGMPEPEPGVLYVVPVEVAMALQEEREDVAYLAEEANVQSASGERHRISHLRRTVRAPVITP